MKPPFAFDRPDTKPLSGDNPERRPCPGLEARLMELARQLGAGGAKIVDTGDIVVDERLAGLCRESTCANYGLARSCPPHVSGPAGLRKLFEKIPGALFFKIDVPTEILASSDTLLSTEGRAVFQLLHETAAAIERSAKEMGFTNARAYAGGSCKNIFCHTHDACRALAQDGQCRHPDVARESMSGFGIDVGKLFKTCGWEMRWVHTHKDATAVPMANLCGLVLIG